MNMDTPQTPRQELECSITALLLGELPQDKAAALRQVLEKDAEMAQLQERMKQAIGLVCETFAAPAQETAAQAVPLKLSDERRQKLLGEMTPGDLES